MRPIPLAVATALLLGVLTTFAVIFATQAAARPSDLCYEAYSDAWCDSQAELLDDLPLWDDLTTEGAGGYMPGDLVETGHGDSVPVPAETLDAVATAGRTLNETATSHDEERLMVDLSACESRFDPDADGPGTAWGGWQFLRSTWNRVASATGITDTTWSAQAANALWLGRHDGWWHWECLHIIR